MKDAIMVGVVALSLAIIGVIVFTFKTSPEYIYIARGITCKSYDKTENVLKDCKDGIFGNVEIINPISVLKVRVK